MTFTQLLFVAGLFVIAAAVTVIATLTWSRRRNPEALLGFAFAAIALASTVNLTLVGHRLRETADDTYARFEERLACTQAIVAALEARDEAEIAGRPQQSIPLPRC